MIRSAEFFGWKKIFVFDKYDLFKEPSTKKERAERKHMGRVWTAGALDHIDIHLIKDDLTFLQEHNGRKIGLILDPTATHLASFSFETNDLVILGNERDGLPAEVVHSLDHKLYIPQVGNTNCLNVAVTFGIVLHSIKNHVS